MMKLGLINPGSVFLFQDKVFLSFWRESADVAYYKRAWSGIGSALTTVAALTPPSFEIKIIDENIETIDFAEPFDLVGISAMTHQAERAYRLAEMFKERGSFVVIGGIHASTFPGDALTHCHSVIAGEAEELWPRFIEDFLKGKAAGIYKSDNTAGTDMTHSPLPRYDLLDTDSYETFWVQTGRGCPHHCMFCAASNIYGPQYRHKTTDQVISELEIIKSSRKNPFICFADDNMFVNRAFSRQLLNRLTPFAFSWIAQTDISIAEDDELLALLYKSGCQAVYIGFESVSDKNLQRIDPRNWKFQRFQRFRESIKKIQSYGIGVHGSFMIGFDNDGPGTAREISEFIIGNHLFGSTTLILTPYPGTVLRNRMEEEGRLLNKPWSWYNGGNVTFQPKKMTPRQLQEEFVRVWQEVYAPEIQREKKNHFKSIYKNLALKKAGKSKPVD